MGVRFLYHEYDHRPNWTRRLITNYNFREMKNNQAVKERLIVSFILQPCSFAVSIIEIRLIKIKDVRLAILLANS